MEKRAKRTRPTRRTFGVRDQLLGKLGPRGYGRLLDQLRDVTVEPAEERKPRRRPRRRK